MVMPQGENSNTMGLRRLSINDKKRIATYIYIAIMDRLVIISIAIGVQRPTAKN
jgi:hypothetical protein